MVDSESSLCLLCSPVGKKRKKSQEKRLTAKSLESTESIWSLEYDEELIDFSNCGNAGLLI